MPVVMFPTRTSTWGDLKTIERGLGFRFCIFSLFLERGSYIGLGVFKRKVSTFLGFSLIDLEKYREIWKVNASVTGRMRENIFWVIFETGVAVWETHVYAHI